jgi:cell pole-organizing protein PopZ
MNTANPQSNDGQAADSGANEPSMAEILASIRRIIADDQALSASLGEARNESPRTGPNGEDMEPAPRVGARGGNQRSLLSGGAENSVTGAFQTLLASRFARHGDVIIDLTREMLRPMLKAWLDANLPAIVERLISAEIERVARSE